MQLSLAVPTLITALGMFFLSIGIDALKVLRSGIRLLPLEWAGALASLSYRTVGYSVAIVGFALLLVAAEVCRRADKRFVAASPGMASPRSFRFAIIPGGLLGMIGAAVVFQWCRT